MIDMLAKFPLCCAAAFRRCIQVALLLAVVASPAWASFVDVTSVGAISGDGLDDSAAVQSAVNNYDTVYFPPGDYNFTSQVFIPSGRTVYGNDYRNVTITIASTTLIAWRIDSQSDISLSDITITRTVGNATESMVRVDDSSDINLTRIRCNDQRSRDPAIMINSSDAVTVYQCNVVGSHQMQRVEDGHLQTFGVGVRAYDTTDITISGCKLVQDTPLTIASPTVDDYYQASAIEVIACSGGTVSCNYIENTGQGIDTGLSDHLDVYYNFVDQCHIAGIKMVNGSSYINVTDNFVRRCGITGIWVSHGTPGPGSTYCVVEDNILVAIGQGIGGSGYWSGGWGSTVPAGIHLESASSSTTRVSNNTIRYNNSYDNGSQLDIVKVMTATYAPTSNTISSNTVQAGSPPTSQFAGNCSTVP